MSPPSSRGLASMIVAIDGVAALFEQVGSESGRMLIVVSGVKERDRFTRANSLSPAESTGPAHAMRINLFPPRSIQGSSSELPGPTRRIAGANAKVPSRTRYA